MSRTYIHAKSSKARNTFDVSITETKDKRYSTQRISFRFLNGVEKFISTTEYMIASYDKETGCIYFEESKQETGYKITVESGEASTRIEFRPTKKEYEFFKIRLGKYKLLYDEKQNLYYISTKEFVQLNFPETPKATTQELRTVRKQLVFPESLAAEMKSEAHKREQSFNQFMIDLFEQYKMNKTYKGE